MNSPLGTAGKKETVGESNSCITMCVAFLETTQQKLSFKP